MRIGINGMGRIGRLLFRRLFHHPNHSVIAINDIMPADNLLYLLKYDSLYGPFNENISLNDIKVMQFDHPSFFSWKDMEIDIVIECSGKFTTREKAGEHLKAGAKKVLLSTTGSTDIPLMIYGFNHHQLNGDTEIISPGGCMSNCATHILYILNSIGIESAHLHVLHSYTSRQELVDTAHPQFRRGRAAAESMIPVEIDLAHSLERLLPQLKNKIAAVSTRVPVTNGAMMDLTIQMKQSVTKEMINALFKKCAQHEYKGIMDYTEDPIVSADIKGNTHSCIIDGTLTSVVGNQLKIVAWFDNEYGYTSRMLDWLDEISKNS